MLLEKLFLSLCRLQPPGAGLVPLGSRGLGTVQSSLARGALLGPGRRRPSHAQSCFPTKENTLGVGFRLRSPQPSSRAQGARGSPAPLCPTVSKGYLRNRLTLLSRAKARFGLVCALRGAFPATLQTAAPRSSSGAVGEMWPRFSATQFASGVIAVVRAEKVLHAQS